MEKSPSLFPIAREYFHLFWRGISLTLYPRQAAIVQGAALRGLEGLQSTTKRCRRHYGFAWGMPFRPGIDDEANSYIHFFTGTKVTTGRMAWMIGKVYFLVLHQSYLALS